MNPIQASRKSNARQASRNVLCRHYNHCLDIAIEKGWNGFSCSQCGDYAPEARGDAEYWEEQDWRSANLLLKIGTGKSAVHHAQAASNNCAHHHMYC